jgi:hypothetical protein
LRASRSGSSERSDSGPSRFDTSEHSWKPTALIPSRSPRSNGRRHEQDGASRPADTVILLLDHQNGLFQTVKDVPLADGKR